MCEKAHLNVCFPCFRDINDGAIMEVVDVTPVPFFCQFCGREMEQDAIGDFDVIADNYESFLVCSPLVQGLNAHVTMFLANFVRGNTMLIESDSRWIFGGRKSA